MMHMPLNNVITIKDGIKMIFCVVKWQRRAQRWFLMHVDLSLCVCIYRMCRELNKHFRMLASSFSATPQCAIENNGFYIVTSER